MDSVQGTLQVLLVLLVCLLDLPVDLEHQWFPVYRTFPVDQTETQR